MNVEPVILVAIISGVFSLVGYIVNQRIFDKRLNSALLAKAENDGKKSDAESEASYSQAVETSSITLQRVFSEMDMLRKAIAERDTAIGQARADMLVLQHEFVVYKENTDRLINALREELRMLKTK